MHFSLNQISLFYILYFLEETFFSLLQGKFLFKDGKKIIKKFSPHPLFIQQRVLYMVKKNNFFFHFYSTPKTKREWLNFFLLFMCEVLKYTLIMYISLDTQLREYILFPKLGGCFTLYLSLYHRQPHFSTL